MNETTRKFDSDKKLAIFISYYKPHWKLFLLDMVCAFAIAIADLTFPVVSRYALNNLLPNNAYRAFFAIIFAMVLVYIVRSMLTYVVNYWGHMLGVQMEADMRRDIFTHLQKLSFSFYDKTRIGQLMSRVVNDLFEIVELAHHGPEDLFISMVTILGSLTMIMFIQWKLALVLFAVLPIMFLYTAHQRVRMAHASTDVKKNTATINASIENSLSGIRVVKAFANEKHEAEKFDITNAVYRKAKNQFYAAMGAFQSGMEFMNSLLYVIVIGFGGYLIMQGEMKVVDLITVNLFVNAFLSPIKKLAQFTEQYESGMAGFSRFMELMNTKPEIVDRPGAKDLSHVKGDIEFKDVTFSYDEDNNVLSGINLKIHSGETLALVGPSGGGKSTLSQLIPRFYEISEGAITIDGIDIRDIKVASLRENIGIVQQDVYLFAGSIRENIMYGDIHATQEQVEEAAKNAEIHDFILTLENGYDTYVGERGVLLSGGQKQRISIARIFLKNPPILILDEATSALDSQTEKKIQSSLEKLSKGRTALIIAHRLSTIVNADKIAYIDDEGVVEKGTHSELLEKNGEYAALYRAQNSRM